MAPHNSICHVYRIPTTYESIDDLAARVILIILGSRAVRDASLYALRNWTAKPSIQNRWRHIPAAPMVWNLEEGWRKDVELLCIVGPPPRAPPVLRRR